MVRLFLALLLISSGAFAQSSGTVSLPTGTGVNTPGTVSAAVNAALKAKQDYNANTVIGPGAATTNNCAKFANTSGKFLADAGAPCGGTGTVTSVTTNNCLSATPTDPITTIGTIALTLVPVEPAASVSAYTIPSSSACTVTNFKNTASNITVTLASISTAGFTSGSGFGVASAAGSGGLTVSSTSVIGTGSATTWPVAAGSYCWFVSGASYWIPLCGTGGGGGANTWNTTTITNTAEIGRAHV